MKSSMIVSAGMLGMAGMLMVIPAFVYAEETSGAIPPDVTVSDTGAGGVIAPPPLAPDANPMLRESPTLPARPGMLRESPTRQGVRAPRDAASGQATGRMMASGTRPLPPKLERELQMRDARIGTGTPTMDARGERAKEMRDRAQVRKGEIMKRQAQLMIDRMKAAIEREIKLADRVDSRILKMKASGIDTAKAEAGIAAARTKIADATAAVSAAESSVADAVANAIAASASSTTPNDAGKSVRTSLEKARDAVKATHKAIVDAVELLKANVKTEVEAHGSTTTSVAN